MKAAKKSKPTLFNRLERGDIFHFYDTPDRKLIKSDVRHYVGPGGRRVISPTVLVFKDEATTNGGNDGQKT